MILDWARELDDWSPEPTPESVARGFGPEGRTQRDILELGVLIHADRPEFYRRVALLLV